MLNLFPSHCCSFLLLLTARLGGGRQGLFQGAVTYSSWHHSQSCVLLLGIRVHKAAPCAQVSNTIHDSLLISKVMTSSCNSSKHHILSCASYFWAKRHLAPRSAVARYQPHSHSTLLGLDSASGIVPCRPSPRNAILLASLRSAACSVLVAVQLIPFCLVCVRALFVRRFGDATFTHIVAGFAAGVTGNTITNPM
jgi:hypothetical protein